MSTNITIDTSYAIELAEAKDKQEKEWCDKAVAAWQYGNERHDEEVSELRRKLELNRKDESFWGPTMAFRELEWKLLWHEAPHRYHELFRPSKSIRAETLLRAFKLHSQALIDISVDDINYLTQ